ncbi:ribonuclease HII [Candidatus Saccharibacteria bacterium]|nr:ribonuclease HII [Candidatus Saccharibacteria bacterium]
MVVGIDEVGRGCWAGPVVASAVILDTSKPIDGLRDSKKMTKSQRVAVAALVRKNAQSYGIGWASAQYVDAHGLTQAVRHAMQQALDKISQTYSVVIIDGSFNFLADNLKTETMVKADDSVPAVSAASIIAKVARDDFMAKQALLYPGYGFERHVGYGTAVHVAALRQFGPTPLHRMSYKPLQALVQ